MTSIQEVTRRSGLPEATLRYYERIGLIAPVPRDPQSGHRRYDDGTVDTIEALACLRTAGMGIDDMRAYLRGMTDPSHQRELFERHSARLADEIERLQVRRRYLDAKVRLWAARERGDVAAEQAAIDETIAVTGELR
ncbi:MerR family transcriptional regulator [Cryptosporangium phraense]|uniref:MerR family transcriptional regulator n=1 Tax=Cryptosporangium phraense TaxID=2593070 RepID=A0A545AMP7_9ACTN|nr:MerR family transcriptional regulator [Cryptosporangium phraense]TQS42015.1 MerR family transcriptional regulator [Cryptosporangium phraense]